MLEYLVLFEQAKDGGWGSYAPDLPGLGVAAETQDEVSALIREGIRIYLEELRGRWIACTGAGYDRRAHFSCG